MLRLRKSKDPYWLEGPLMKLLGVRLFVKPLDAQLSQTASAAARREIVQLGEAMQKIKDTGGDVTGLPDISDENVREGMASVITVKYFAIYGILQWEGVATPDSPEDAPVPQKLTPEAIKDFLDFPGIFNEFSQEYQKDTRLLELAKNVFSVEPSGTTDTAENTVTTVPSSDLPVPGESVSTDDSVPISSMTS